MLYEHSLLDNVIAGQKFDFALSHTSNKFGCPTSDTITAYVASNELPSVCFLCRVIMIMKAELDCQHSGSDSGILAWLEQRVVWRALGDIAHII